MDNTELGQALEVEQERLAEYAPKKGQRSLGLTGAMIEQVAFRLNDRINLNKQEEKIGEWTGFKFLDETIHGFLKTHFWIVGGYTSHGKTALMIQFVINAALGMASN